MVARVVGELGCIDILINCVGRAARGAFLNLTDHDWLGTVNLKLMASIRGRADGTRCHPNGNCECRDVSGVRPRQLQVWPGRRGRRRLGQIHLAPIPEKWLPIFRQGYPPPKESSEASPQTVEACWTVAPIGGS